MANFSRPFFITIVALMVIPAACSKNSAITGEDTDETGSVTEGSPIDLPVPIAKGIDGVAPATVRLAESSSDLNVLMPTARQGSGEVIGTLHFELVNEGSDRLVALIASEKIVDSTVTSNGAGSFLLTSDLVGTPLALVVAGSATTTSNNGSWSLPVVVTVYVDTEGLVTGNYFFTVAMTNTSRDTKGAVRAADIENYFALPSTGTNVSFPATDQNGVPFVGSVPINGGDIDIISDEPPNLLAGIAYDDNDILTGWDEVTGAIYRLDTAGSVVYTESSALIPDPSLRHFSFSPDNRWMAVNRLTTDASFGLTFIDLNDPSLEIVPMIQGLSLPADNLFFDWRDNENLLAFPPIELGVLYNLDVGNVLAGNTTTLVPSAVFEGELGGIRLFYNEARNEVVYNCNNNELQLFHLCLYDFDNDVGEVIVDEPQFNITWIELAPDESYVVFMSVDPGTAELNPIGIYVFETGETFILGKGVRPVPSPTDPNIIVYGSCDTTGNEICDDDDVGGIQVCLFNLENLGIDL